MDQLRRFLEDTTTISPKAAYDYGYDCGKNGPNQENCHFRIFSSPENTKAWERGKKAWEDRNA